MLHCLVRRLRPSLHLNPAQPWKRVDQPLHRNRHHLLRSNLSLTCLRQRRQVPTRFSLPTEVRKVDSQTDNTSLKEPSESAKPGCETCMEEDMNFPIHHFKQQTSPSFLN